MTKPIPPTERKLRARIRQLERVLEFYADPYTYFAIAFRGERPHGNFFTDLSETTELGKKPGKRARVALGWEEP